VLDGATSVRDLEADYEVPLPRDEGFETLAGFVMAHLQRIPNPAIASSSKATASPSNKWKPTASPK